MAVSMFGFAAGCDDSPTGPTDETITFTAQLLPANEVPPVTGPEASGSGSVTIQLHVTKNSAGTITQAEADFQVTLAGFPNDTPVTMAHIHPGAAGVNGGILVDTGVVPGQVILGNGSGGFTRNGISATGGLTPTVAQNIINTPANFYFNVHSVLNATGMARGQLVKQ